jgi:hypothetical protein
MLIQVNQDPYLQFASDNTIKANIHYDNTATDLIFQTNTNQTALTIDNSQNSTFAGNVGIGITPVSFSQLHLYDTSDIFITLQKGTDIAYLINDGTNIALASDQGSTGKKLLVDRTAPDNSLTIDSSGNSTFAGSITANTTSTPTLIVGRDGTDGDAVQVYNGATGSTKSLAISVDGNDGTIYSQYGDIILQPSAGNVGIGTDTPNYSLDVQKSTGSAYFRLRRGFSGTEGAFLFGCESATNFIDSQGTSSSVDKPFVFKTGGDERMRIDSSGNVGIGGSAGDGYRLQVVGTSQDSTTISMTYVGVGAGALKMTSNGAMAFGVDNADGASGGQINMGTSTNYHQFEPEADMDFNFIMNAGQINASPNYTIKSSTSGGAITSRLQLIGSTGNMTITGSLTQNGSISDISLKENIKPVENGLDKIKKLNAVSFDWKKSDSILQLKEDYGFIAQEVEKVIPEIVRTNNDDKKAINYNGITSVLVKAIQELKAEVDKLKQECKCKN